MSDRNKACLAELSKDLGDVLENAEKIKGVNYRLYVTHLANVSTIAKVMGYLKASSNNPDAEAMLAVITGALAMNAKAYADALGLEAGDREEALKTAGTLSGIMKSTNEAYDNGHKS